MWALIRCPALTGRRVPIFSHPGRLIIGIDKTCLRHGRSPAMAPTKEQVLQALTGVNGPDGSPLPATGALSDIVVSDAKVFFSITVDAAVVQRWEPVRR